MGGQNGVIIYVTYRYGLNRNGLNRIITHNYLKNISGVMSRARNAAPIFLLKIFKTCVFSRQTHLFAFFAKFLRSLLTVTATFL